MYAYEKLMQEHDLKKADLPKDAQIGIKSIKQIENAIKMTEARGQNVSQAVKDKLRANDKWVTGEILAFLDDDETEEELPHEPEEVIEEIEEDDETEELAPEQHLGYDIDEELHKLYEQGEQSWNLDKVKKVAPKTYKHIFETYEQGGENGVVTSNYAFIESENEMVFNLQKK